MSNPQSSATFRIAQTISTKRAKGILQGFLIFNQEGILFQFRPWEYRSDGQQQPFPSTAKIVIRMSQQQDQTNCRLIERAVEESQWKSKLDEPLTLVHEMD